MSRYDTDRLDGSDDCVDRLVLPAYHTLCSSAGGFRLGWGRLLQGQEDTLDNAHLMRLAGRFSRRVRADAPAHAIPVIACGRGERTQEIAAEDRATHPTVQGLFLMLVGCAVAPVWEVERSARGAIRHLRSKKPSVNHYAVPLLDADWGHRTIKMSGHPPCGAQIIVNGHEDVAAQARRAGLTLLQEGNCFPPSSSGADLAHVADAVSEQRTLGRLTHGL